MTHRRLTACAALTCVLAFARVQDARQEVTGFLQAVGFRDADATHVHDGHVVARASMPDDREIIAVGAVKIRASRDQVLSYYGQMISYVDGKVTIAFGRFSSPPALADVDGLAFDHDEIEQLRSCRVGDCDIRLGGASLNALRSSIDWTANGYAEEVNRYLRRTAVAYITDYQTRGDAALVTYDDRARPVSLRDQWAGILQNARTFQQYTPDLRDYLAQYPARPLPGATDIFYWVKENYGLKPVVSLVHGVVYQPADKPDRVFVVQKQLYASHYYDGSLATGAVVSAIEAGAPVSYLLYGNRSRGDLLKGGFGGLRRTVALRQAETAARQTLTTIKQVLEQGR
jgi:hypothetical protein